jgi:hypothetical protein
MGAWGFARTRKQQQSIFWSTSPFLGDEEPQPRKTIRKDTYALRFEIRLLIEHLRDVYLQVLLMCETLLQNLLLYDAKSNHYRPPMFARAMEVTP